ncbi:MAG: hypothetical protein LBT76_02240, partial [Tannerella sp.]|nr:hypothetical protein [Tannerella sp.]
MIQKFNDSSLGIVQVMGNVFLFQRACAGIAGFCKEIQRFKDSKIQRFNDLESGIVQVTGNVFLF